jgi:chemotaxis response regulator CheB
MTVQRRLGSRAFIRLDPFRASHLHVPSVDTLMKSVAQAFEELAMGVILTGMGADGAEGMSAMQRHGGFTIGQDEASCTVYSMPRVCAERGSLLRIVPLSRIPAEILKATRYRKACLTERSSSVSIPESRRSLIFRKSTSDEKGLDRHSVPSGSIDATAPHIQ